ncbi:MAG: glycosyltransferase family 39 protein [Myxococcota bacterium]|nr:glycosyltransferase family 39 protein [Myxococcota bacterium]
MSSQQSAVGSQQSDPAPEPDHGSMDPPEAATADSSRLVEIRNPNSEIRTRHIIGVALGIAYLAVLLATARDVGFSRDEGFYFTSADAYQEWFDVLFKEPGKAATKGVVERYWHVNAEHPPLMKVLFGFSHRVFHKKLEWLSPSTSYRLPGMLCGALLIYLVYIFVARRIGGMEAFLSASLLALMPAFFYHAHLSCFDVPISLMVFATVYAFEKSLRSNLWAVLAGVLFGLALLTKLNAFFIPPTLLALWALRDLVRPAAGAILFAALVALVLAAGFATWALVAAAAAFLVVFLRACDLRGGRIAVPRIPMAFVWMAILGPLMLFGLWPWLWHDTWKHFGGFLSFHIDHDHYNIAYFGVNYFRPPLPISYPFGMTALTTPVITLAAGALGMAMAIRHRLAAIRSEFAGLASAVDPDAGGLRARLGALLLTPWRSARPRPLPDDSVAAALERNPGIGMCLAVNMMAPMLLIAHPRVFIFGGTKHWMPAWPFVAIFAGMGLAWALRRIAALIPDRLATLRAWRVALPLRPVAAGALALLCLAPAVQGTAQSHPFGLSHYNLPAGGVPGSADLGMCRQFWGFTTGSLLPWLNANVPRNGAVFFHDTAWDSYRMFQRDGSLRQDIRWAGSPDAAVVSLVHHEMHMAETEYWIWQAYGTPDPVTILTHHGVPIISVYARPGATLGFDPVGHQGPTR